MGLGNQSAHRTVAFAVGLIGVLSIVSALLPAQHSRLALLNEIVGDTTTGVATGTTAAIGVAMVLLSAGLRRRQRAAWAASVLLASAAS